ncbi:MAG: DUF3108 domain-containing protein [Bdellovibrionales bacterium]|nr:DUF3108 domain-containing protein [Bdellovibrionales bacterium]
MRRFSILLALMLAAASAAVPALADYIEPGAVKIKTAPYLPFTTDFRGGVYRYDVTWQGIPVADASVSVQRGEISGVPFFHVRADAKTVSAVKLFYKLKHRSEAMFRADTLEPFTFYSKDVERRKQKYRQVYFDDGGRIRFKSSKNGKQSSDEEFFTENGTLDPFSAAFLARSLPIHVGSVKEFDVFNGKHRFLISFEVTGTEVLETKQGRRNSFKVVPTVQKLTDTSGREERLKSATIWISADSYRDILQVESKVLVGSVSAKLDRFYPAQSSKDEWNKAIQASISIAPHRFRLANVKSSS